MNRLTRTIISASAAILASASLIYAQTGNLANPALPALKIITPGENQTVYGNKVPVLLSVENFEIVDYEKNPAPKAGQGHIHLWLDDENPSAQNATKITDDNFTFSDVPYGNHTLRAELVGNNHASLNPPQVATAKFKNSPISSPTPVTTSGFDKNTALVILVIVALVIVAAWWYTKEEDEGEPESKVPPGRRAGKSQKSKSKRKISRRRTKV